MRLFDLVEEHDGIRFSPHLLRQLSALVVTDVARRRADQPRDRVLFHIFAHIDADHRLLAAEDRLGERAAQLRLAHARRSQEQERAHGPLWVLHACPPPPHRAGDRAHSLVLPHDALVQRVLE